MKKNGFTLVEIMAVLVIISILASLVTFGVLGILRSSHEELLETKIQNIERAASLYGQENQDELLEKCTVDGIEYDSCCIVTVEKLLEGSYFKSTEIDENGNMDLINNVTSESMLKDNVQIYRKNNNIYAKYIGK